MSPPPSLRYTVVQSPIGPLHAAFTDQGLCRLDFGRSRAERQFVSTLPAAACRVRANALPVGRQFADELAAYFAGEAVVFRTPLDLRSGTSFQREVWDLLRRIPFGRTMSYGQVACEVGRPGAARAVGQAVGANPVGIVVPCHRVIGASGALGGFGAGLPIKRWLLRHEGVFPRGLGGR